MLYSKSAEYSIQTMVDLSEFSFDKPVIISKIAASYNIPYQSLVKIVQILVKHRLIMAKRGRNGVFMLRRKAKIST